jgi:hypothetical protein
MPKPALSAAEGPANGSNQDRIRGIQESGLKCGSHQIPAESRKFIRPHSACFDPEGDIFVVEYVEVGRVTKLRKVA